MSLEYRIGDVFDRLAEIGDGTIDLIVTSPPFLALRSYLPADHPDKAKEIGSEATPAQFIDALLALSAEFGRVLAPHGSLCVELGDTFSGGGGENHLWDSGYSGYVHGRNTKKPQGSGRTRDTSTGWPLAKSLTGIPTLYPWSLAYGRNLLTGQPSPAGLWRIRNIIVWARPNPPVGALGDKFRPATSYITVACRGVRRFFDLDAVRTPLTEPGALKRHSIDQHNPSQGWESNNGVIVQNAAGAPPLDWHTDCGDGDWLWKLPTQPYRGAHFATFPLELPTRLIRAMCPLRVCTVCGKPSERIVESERIPRRPEGARFLIENRTDARASRGMDDERLHSPNLLTEYTTVGWSDCGHNAWRTGVTLDPFAGSGTSLEAAQNVGRHAIGIDLDPRNAHLAQTRVGMFLEVVA